MIARLAGLVLAVGCVAACGTRHGGSSGGSSVPSQGSYKVGKPYTIEGRTYVPQEEFNHVETGVASWYGPGFHGKSTANGERYDQQDHTAAHRTLQMPAIVRVTNLDNGRSTVVRINDRGPYAQNRVIDLSRAAATELDMIGRGTARVRLDQLTTESLIVKEVALGGGGPTEQHQALAQHASGNRPGPVTAVAIAQPPRLAPTPVSAPAPASVLVEPAQPVMSPALASGGQNRATIASIAAGVPPAAAPVPSAGGSSGFYVQTGAFSTMDNAERQRGLVRSYGISEISPASAGGREVYRVRLGPYTTPDAAGIVADRLKRSGYGDARVVAD
jgi:rare lipoprotein A